MQEFEQGVPRAHAWKSALRLAPFLLLAAYSLTIAMRLAPRIAYDDAAIGFRYVERFVAGHGLTYNDHEAVQGASNPLYLLVLASLHALGAGVEQSARVVGALLFVASVLITAQLTARLSNQALGFLAGLALASDGFYRVQALSGMESVLSVVLGLLAVLLGMRGREGAAGLVLGLAIVNKLDAGFLALAVGVSWLVAQRRLPATMIVGAIATVAPWAAYAAATYGSVIPNSVVTKLGHHLDPFDPWWVTAPFRARHTWWILVPIAAQVLSGFRASRSKRFGTWALGAWFLMHGGAFALIDLGAAYPWYLTVLVPPWLMLGAAGLSAPVKWCTGSRSLRWIAVSALSALYLIPMLAAMRGSTLEPLRSGVPLLDYETFDADRRLAGIFVRAGAQPAEVVSSAFGWIAFESRQPTDDESGLNTRHKLGNAAYRATHGSPHASGWHAPMESSAMLPVANLDLTSDLFPGFTWFTVFARADSAIARSRLRYLKQRLPDFPEPRALGDGLPLAAVDAPAGDLQSALPGGAQFDFADVEENPLHLVFVPRVEAINAPSGESAPERRATFEIEVDAVRIFRIDVSDEGPPVVVRIRSGAKRFSLALRALTDRAAHDLTARWVGLKLIRGELPFEPSRVLHADLANAWCRFNPCAGATEPTAPRSR